MRFPSTDIEFAMQAEIDDLRAENKRLREALENCIEYCDYCEPSARAALQQNDPVNISIGSMTLNPDGTDK